MNIGIIGDGQLGRMLALSAYHLGVNFGFLGNKNSSSGHLGTTFNTIEELDNYADVLTYESENTSIEFIKHLKTPVYPPINALKITQNRTLEKDLFHKLNIPCVNNTTINSLKELLTIIKTINMPCIIKTTTEGYDGKGQFLLKNKQKILEVWNIIGNRELIIEDFIEFDYEVSMIAVFSKDDSKYYPLTKNTHKDGILRTSKVINNPALFIQAKKYADLIAKKFNYIGVLTIEFFVKDNKLIANEIAPRVHNSGHWSIDGAIVSQFENHIRSICNLPLGDTTTIYNNITMENIIGVLPNTKEILQNKHKFLHLYNKSARNNRKLGHINICR